MKRRVPVTVLGATGVVGQRLIRRLASHPIFELAHLVASDRKVGMSYGEACTWQLEGEAYAGFGARVLESSESPQAQEPVVFSALDTEVARELEPRFAQTGSLVFSNASAFRMEEDVPLLVPEVNPEHLNLLEIQRKRRAWKGGILTNPNCTTTILVMALAPLQKTFGIEAVVMTSMQAVSGAGYPGVSSLDIMGNIIPFIRNEEEKVQEETPKLLGLWTGESVLPAQLSVTALCHRVPVLEGHTEAVCIKLKGDPDPEKVRQALEAWKPQDGVLKLPSAPQRPIHLYSTSDRPQVRRDVEKDGGMAIHVGRIRSCPVLGLKFTLLGHNTERGAAGGCLLNAELALEKGWV